MHCQEIEMRILDYQENNLPPGETVAVENHLAHCAGCRAFARQMTELDSTLAAAIKVPVLPANFDQRLREKIHGEVVLPESKRAERRRQLQAEFEAKMARMEREKFAFSDWLGQLAWLFGAALAAWEVWLFVRALSPRLNGLWLGFLDPRGIPFLVAAAIILASRSKEIFPHRRWT
jgi:anti-sigma factor RsiW